jgi:hypothetical protein
MDSLSRLVCRVRSGILLGGVIGLAGGTWGRAEILNDGTTTNRLVRLANSDATTFGNTSILRVDAAGSPLVAEQLDQGFLWPFPALRSSWFAGNAAVTGAVYRVSSEFRPAAANPANQGGVIGWLNTGASNAIVLKVVPGDGGPSLPYSFQLSHVDFTGTTPDANENLNFLFDLDGEPAANSFESAWSEPTGYQPGEFGRFELEFAVPTAEQVSVVTNATVTALVTAKVFQGAGGGTPAQVGRTIELLTTLPVPPVDRHRVGYYGVWSSAAQFGTDVIGYYRNLSAEGQVVIQLNIAPSVTLTQPAAGTTRTAPATFSLVANATDADGTIAAVEFFAGTNSLGRVTASPFVWSWSGVAEGSYQLTAVATDNLGDATTSEPVGVTVLPFSGTGPTLSVEVQGEMIHLEWSSAGFQLQYKTGVEAPTWIDVPNTTGVSQIDLPVSLGAQYFRLIGAGTPGGPVLSVSVTGTDITVSWPPATVGYRLQSNILLGATGWTDLPTTGNTFTEPIAGAARFYRLVQ